MFGGFAELRYLCTMKKQIATVLLLLCQAAAWGQGFSGRIECAELNVYMVMDFAGGKLTAPGHELVGEVAGYMAKHGNGFFWLATSAKVKGDKAELTLINDYGSEDLRATLTQKDDSTYIFRQIDGSTIKLPNKGKWQKMPKEMVFKRKK